MIICCFTNQEAALNNLSLQQSQTHLIFFQIVSNTLHFFTLILLQIQQNAKAVLR